MEEYTFRGDTTSEEDLTHEQKLVEHICKSVLGTDGISVGVHA